MLETGTVFVVIEGHNKAGKTTMVEEVSRRLRACGISTATFRDPGGTPLGEAIRSLTKDNKELFQAIESAELCDQVQQHLYAASRLLLADEIKKSTAQVVICDRWYYSTLVYNYTPSLSAWMSDEDCEFEEHARQAERMLHGLSREMRSPDLLVMLEREDVLGRDWEKDRYLDLFLSGAFRAATPRDLKEWAGKDPCTTAFIVTTFGQVLAFDCTGHWADRDCAGINRDAPPDDAADIITTMIRNIVSQARTGDSL